MKGIVLTGHGNFASGLNTVVENVYGAVPQYEFVEFPFDNADVFESRLLAAANIVDTGDGVIFCTDMVGGTPFNRASKLALENGRYVVLTGCNFTSIIAAIDCRETFNDQDTLVREIIEAGRNGLTSLCNISLDSDTNVEDADGI